MIIINLKSYVCKILLAEWLNLGIIMFSTQPVLLLFHCLIVLCLCLQYIFIVVILMCVQIAAVVMLILFKSTVSEYSLEPLVILAFQRSGLHAKNYTLVGSVFVLNTNNSYK